MAIFDYLLTILLALPLVAAGVVALLPAGENGQNTHRVATIASALIFAFSLLIWQGDAFPFVRVATASLFEIQPWLPSLGISYAVGTDGLSLTMVILTTFLLLMAVIASWTNITKRHKLYYSMLFILTTAVLGVFLARDLFLFFLFYELELIPMYFLIAIWGGPNRRYASVKFVLYTLFGSVFLLAGILGIYALSLQQGAPMEGVFLFESVKSNITGISLAAQSLIFLSLFVGFAVKLPVVPVHTWLPDAHVEAPTPVSMLLAGILLKMGAYGMLRFCYEFMPEPAVQWSPWVALLAVINIVYTAGIALVQKDLKKLIAYSSVSHMGFVLLGLASMNPAGFNGAVFVMFAHGIVSAALFMCVGVVYLRTHTRMIADFGGLATKMPAYFFAFLFMAMASLGLPLLISFASETLVFYGAYTSNLFEIVWANGLFGSPVVWNMQLATILSALGVVIGAAYLLWMIKRVFFGKLNEKWAGLPDLSFSEVMVLASLGVLVVAYGLQPQWLVKRFEPWVTAMAMPYSFFEHRQQVFDNDGMHETYSPQQPVVELAADGSHSTVHGPVSFLSFSQDTTSNTFQ